MGKLHVECADCRKRFRVEVKCFVVPPTEVMSGVCVKCRMKRKTRDGSV